MSADAGRRLRMDMHVHTHRSYDCLNRPERLAEAARAAGLDRVVVTDHNEIDGALRMRELDPERFLVGEEIRTREGPEIIGILLTERIPRGTPAREVCERIVAQGGVVYLPHPFDTRRSGAAPILDRIADLVDAVEVHNARCYDVAFNRMAAEWAVASGKAIGAGSDAHTVAELGRGAVEVPDFAPTREGLLAALRQARLVSSVTSSRIASVASTYAKLRKRLG